LAVITWDTETDKKGMNQMIEWIKYDPANPPEVGKEYLVTDKHDVDISGYVDPLETGAYWEIEQIWSDSPVSYVSHYAHINLPGEEDRP
jgi:hypothetical protein